MSFRDNKLFKEACFINGNWRFEGLTDRIEVFDPATQQCLGTVPALDAVHVHEAILAAESAFPLWASLDPKERADMLLRWHNLILAHQKDLAYLLTREQGKPLAEARDEILYAASFVRWFAEEARRVRGDIIQATSAQERLFVYHEPVGVCAAITPWNFPAAMITRKVAPALAAGCTILVRPSELTPFTALALAALAEGAELPAGVFQVITGHAETVGTLLATDPRIQKLSFTGSTPVGRKLMASASSTLKRLSLELGGNAPFIVFEDASLEDAVKGCLTAKFRNSGQTCIAPNRVLVHEKVSALFCDRLCQELQHLKVGNGLEEGTHIGPLINEKAVAKLRLHSKDALQKGAKLVFGGHFLTEQGNNNLYVGPVVLTGVTPDMLCAQEENFGPLLPIMVFHEETEALSLANGTPYGLAAYFYSKDYARIMRVCSQLNYGMVAHNTPALSREVAPFGGVKQSGFGREGSHYGLQEYMQLKYVCSRVSL